MRETLSAAFEIKAADGDGVFEGYASVFGLADDGDDVVLPGAFAKSLKEKAPGDIKLLWQHDPTQPIGRILALREDARGLYVKGALLPEIEQGREALCLMQGGALDGLSIGYRTRRSRLDEKTGMRQLLDVDLWEISLVTFPMQRAARIQAFKGDPRANIREFEAFLREAGGFSRRQAKALAASGFKALGRRDVERNWAPALQSINHLIDQLKECSDEQRHDAI